MHIMLISACEKRALKKTRAVLDSYALRTGDRSWATPIALEGLRELRAALKRVATRQTAVACYANEGRSRMRLLWLVGSRRKFGHQGHFPSGYTRVHRHETVPIWLRVVSLLAKAGGYGHDFGKASAMFQGKLSAGSFVRDAVRHEWASMKLLQAWRKARPDVSVWENAFERQLPVFLRAGVSSATDAVDYVVSTHHGLYGPRNSNALPDTSNHLCDDGTPIDRTGMRPAGEISPLAWERQQRAEARLEALAGERAPLFWRAACVLARAALIFADHVVSARWQPGTEGELRANTGMNPATREVELNQSLFDHLGAVGDMAGSVAYRMSNIRLPGLSDEAVGQILTPATQPRFLWQNQAVAALIALREQSAAPVLVMNLAGTGSGKTRANAKCACALGQAGRIRFATALNLRSLTLQTGTAYREQLNIGADECATIIGDWVVRKMYERGRQVDRLDVDENGEETEFDATELDFVAPAWLDAWLNLHPKQKAILGAPVLVSTVDYLIAAGEPHRQGHHVSALLRMADSDLILDEVDSYDPKAMIAVLRSVQMAAFFGRNVICSSATLAFPVADAVHQAFVSGLRLYAALRSIPLVGHVALINNFASPVCFSVEEGFVARYEEHLFSMFANMPNDSYRKAVLLRLHPEKKGCPTIADWQAAVLNGVKMLHDNNSWVFSGTEKRVSFGLVRTANIRVAIKVARYLSSNLPHARVACYHANELRIQRYEKERRLDRLLTRHQGNAHIEADPEIRALVMRAGSNDVPFIVVATPVEEIGRDHDFDWAVIEPSSTQSIVQTAGRVNRHRLEVKTVANVGILQLNARFVENFEQRRRDKAVFCYPGLESNEELYASRDIKNLLPWDDKNELTAFDARLRFVGVGEGWGCRFAEFDDKSLRRSIGKFKRIFFDVDTPSPLIMAEGAYRDTPLREHCTRNVWMLEGNGSEYVYSLRKVAPGEREASFCDSTRLVRRIERADNDWLSWDLPELLFLCGKYGVSHQRGQDSGMLFELRIRFDCKKNGMDDSSRDAIVHDQSFGFYTEKDGDE